MIGNKKSEDMTTITENNINETSKSSSYINDWKIWVSVGVIALFIAVTMQFGMRTSSQITKKYAPLIDAVNNIKTEATFAHLEIEYFINGNRQDNLRTIHNHLNNAEWYAQAMLEGGEKDIWVYTPLEEPLFRQNTSEVLDKIRTFSLLAKEKLAHPEQSQAGADIEQQLNSLFYNIVAQSHNVETAIEQSMFKDIKQFNKTKYILILSSLFFIILIGIILYRYQRKQSNRQIRQSQQKFALHIEQTPLGVIQWDLNFNVTEWNKAAEKIFGFTSEESIGRCAIELIISKSEKEIANKLWDNLLHQKENIQIVFENVTKDNKIITCEWYNTPLVDENEKIIGVASLMMDITERKKAEKAVRDSEERSKKLSNLTFEGIFIHDKGVCIDINESLLKLVGYSKEEIIGKNMIELSIPKKYHSMIKENMNRNNTKPYEIEARKKDGTLFPIEVESRITKYNDIRVTAIRDITERKKAEESNALLSRAIEQAADTIVITDAKGNIQYVNPAFEKSTGFTSEEVIGQNPRVFKSGQHDDAFYKEMWKTLVSGKQWHGEIINKKKDGTLFTENAVFSSISNSNGEIVNYIVAKNDISETKRLQELESRAERLEMAGIIAGQVAHDFNNLLAPIMAYPEFIREELPQDHPAQSYLDTIEQAATKISEINQDLLTMGRRGHYNQDVINLNHIILHTVKEMESRTNTIKCNVELSERLKKIKGGSAQIHRMLTNLLVNAQDAMQNNGIITIKTENYYADDTSIAFGRVPKGEYVKLTVTDNGCGIPDNIIQKILDPFFSTKSAGKKSGSGLGMSVVDSVIKDHNGYLDLYSKVGVGTSFYLYFPISKGETEKTDTEQSKIGTEKVLVVDDDDIQREVSTQLLKKLGYKVNTVTSGEQAVEFLKETPQDIIILDMIMSPGIDGTETYRQILETNPQQKAIIVSGFSESKRVVEAQKLGVGAFVKKPFTKSTIAAAVRTELDKETTVLTT